MNTKSVTLLYKSAQVWIAEFSNCAAHHKISEHLSPLSRWCCTFCPLFALKYNWRYKCIWIILSIEQFYLWFLQKDKSVLLLSGTLRFLSVFFFQMAKNKWISLPQQVVHVIFIQIDTKKNFRSPVLFFFFFFFPGDQLKH